MVLTEFNEADSVSKARIATGNKLYFTIQKLLLLHYNIIRAKLLLYKSIDH